VILHRMGTHRQLFASARVRDRKRAPIRRKSK
jgi:hypothetical protein